MRTQVHLGAYERYSNERVADSMIDPSNVDELALAWSAPIEAPRGMAGIPIVDDQERCTSRTSTRT